MIEQISNSDLAEQIAQVSWKPRIVHLRTAISDLDSAHIPFAILQHDPLPDFKSARNTGLDQIEKTTDAATAVREAWHIPFRSLKVEQIFFLHAWSTVPHATQRMRSAGLSVAIATPGTEYRRWLTTFAVKHRGEVVAWCETIDMRDTGSEYEVELLLSEERMIKLSSPVLK